MAEEVKNKKNSDFRTFGIALVTAVLVVALYHLGLGLCRIYFPECDTPPPCAEMAPPQQLYVLVPVGGAGGGREGMCRHRFGGDFRKGRREKGAMRGDFRKGRRDGQAGRQELPPQKPAPADPQTPAPAPAEE